VCVFNPLGGGSISFKRHSDVSDFLILFWGVYRLLRCHTVCVLNPFFGGEVITFTDVCMFVKCRVSSLGQHLFALTC